MEWTASAVVNVSLETERGCNVAAKRKYDWETWFARKTTILVKGVDYHCSQSAMVQSIRNNAYVRGVRVRPVDLDDRIELTVLTRTKKTPAVSK